MINDPFLLRYIRKEIERYLNIIMASRTQNSTKTTEDVVGLFPGMQAITGKPIMRMFGLISRAPNNTGQVTARFGADPNALMVLGHMDQNAPDVGPGETRLYSAQGHTVHLKSGEVFIKTAGGLEITIGTSEVKIGSAGASNPVVLGTELKELMGEIITWLKSHQHNVSGVSPGMATIPSQAPLTASQLDTIKANFIDNDEIVSQNVFVSKG